MRTPALVGVVAALSLLLQPKADVVAARQASPPPQQAQPQQQQPPPQDQPTRIKTGINFVRVDVIVTDRKGTPLLDLKQDEFRIKEDGKAQAIESFTVVKTIDEVAQMDMPTLPEIRSLDDEKREAARPDARLFVLFLDDYHVRRGNDMSVRKPLIDFVMNQLGPADMVAVMYPLTPLANLSFTRNKRSLVSAIEHFEGRRFNYLPKNEFEERYSNYPVEVVERIRNQVTMTAIRGAAIKLGGMREGRKHIILVSEGFTNSVPPQLNDPIASMPGVGNPNRRNPNAALSDRAEWTNNLDLISDLSLIFQECNRNNTSIYALDPKGLAAFEYDINQGVGLNIDRKHLEASLDTLRALADNTDGRAIINRNDLAKGMQQIIRDSSGYYLIGYNSSDAPVDGRFHKIDVEVTRKGVEVRARKGYWAYTAEDAARATAPARPDAPPAVTNALATLVEPARGLPARFWVGTTRGEAGKSRVTFVWEPVPVAPGEQRRPNNQPASHVTLTALAPDGRPLFRGRVPDQPGPPASASGAAPPATSSSTTFEVPPGQLQLRMVVQTADGEVMDASTREITVPDYTKVQVSFGTPRLFRARTPREVQAVMSNVNAVPVADRTFARTDRVVLRVDAFAPGGAVPTVTARLLNRAGTPMSDVPVKATGGTAELELVLASYAAGDYLIELIGKTESGTAQEMVAFKLR
ncbi:MAG TPA: VWA domain-containing protein [Vicinamibacterales bacterium]|jgi:VWFA-related protein